MMTHPDFVLQATKDRQERITADVHALHAGDEAERPGRVRRTVGGALITLGERVGGRRAAHEPTWTATPTTTIHAV